MLAAGPHYIILLCIFFYWDIKYQFSNMIKRDIKQQDLKPVHLCFVNLNNFHPPPPLEDRISETQLQVGENSN